MRTATERLRAWLASGDVGISFQSDISKALDELDAAKTENLEWLRIARGLLDSDTDSPSGAAWFHLLNEMRRGRAGIYTPLPIVDDLLEQLHVLRDELASRTVDKRD